MNDFLATLLRALLIGFVRLWQALLRPVLGSNCRFHPGCSDYALEAIREYGAIQGGWMAIRRILRCNPWHPGGYDPVPPHEGCDNDHHHDHGMPQGKPRQTNWDPIG
jgi:putative membrane protein insertion efficiency factor